MAQSSSLGVEISNETVVSAIGPADDRVLVATNLQSIQNLLQLSLHYCSKYNVELCPDKTYLQVYTPKSLTSEVNYLKEYSPVELNGSKVIFKEDIEHLGIIRSVTGNFPNILN